MNRHKYKTNPTNSPFPPHNRKTNPRRSPKTPVLRPLFPPAHRVRRPHKQKFEAQHSGAMHGDRLLRRSHTCSAPKICVVSVKRQTPMKRRLRPAGPNTSQQPGSPKSPKRNQSRGNSSPTALRLCVSCHWSGRPRHLPGVFRKLAPDRKVLLFEDVQDFLGKTIVLRLVPACLEVLLPVLGPRPSVVVDETRVGRRPNCVGLPLAFRYCSSTRCRCTGDSDRPPSRAGRSDSWRGPERRRRRGS